MNIQLGRSCARSGRLSQSTHLVLSLTAGIPHRILSCKLVCNLYIQISLSDIVGLVAENSADFFALLNGEDFAKVEYSLFPMSVLGMRTGREADGFVAGSEVDIKPCDHGVDEVIALDMEKVFIRECEVFCLTGVEIEFEDLPRISDNGLEFDGIDERLSKGGVF